MACYLSGVAFRGARLRFRCLDVSVLWSSRRHEGVDELPRRFSNLANSQIESLRVDPGGTPRSTDLADELQRRRLNLIVGRGRFVVVKGSNISAHATSVLRCVTSG